MRNPEFKNKILRLELERAFDKFISEYFFKLIWGPLWNQARPSPVTDHRPTKDVDSLLAQASERLIDDPMNHLDDSNASISNILRSVLNEPHLPSQEWLNSKMGAVCICDR